MFTETITAILKTYVLQGSMLFTDEWASYKQDCEKFGLEYRVLNHRKHLNDLTTGISTNTSKVLTPISSIS